MSTKPFKRFLRRQFIRVLPLVMAEVAISIVAFAVLILIIILAGIKKP